MKKTTAINKNVGANSFAQSNKDAVIPAQAGIQQKKNAAQRTKPLSRDARNTSTNWIPACAGMTQSFGRSDFNPIFRATSLILALAAIGLTTLPTHNAYANPQGGQIVAGSATIVQETAAKVGITQTTDKAIIDWQKYSIGASEHVQYYQPSAASVTLNRVVGQDPSQILGRLTANGQVFLVNPNGIFFGKNAQIDVAGLVASTHNIRNEDFLAGKYNFNIPGNPGAAVINEGNIRIADTGIAAFVAPSVANRGVIAARLGKVMLASANGFTLDFTGDQLITFLVNDEVAQTAFDIEGKQLTSFVENAGRIEAQGGYVLLTAKAAENVVHSVINQSGSIEATTVGTHNGTIILNAGTGTLSVSGILDASAPLPPLQGEGWGGDGLNGGFIETSGAHVTIDPNAKITTAAAACPEPCRRGKTGHWLIDPTDYTIAASGGDITGAALATYLAASNIEIQTLATGSSGNGDIFVNDGVTWNNFNKLTLTAHRNININASINAAGGGSVKLRADSLGAGTGTVAFGGSGHITVSNGAAVGIYYNPTSYTNAATKSDANGNPYSGFVTLNGGSTLTAYMLVNDVNQLQAVNTNLSGNYALGKNIDASATSGWNSGAGFSPIGNTFSGVIDGGSHTISGLFINMPSTTNIGMFVSNSGWIKNLGLINANVTGNNGTGILVSNNTGNITDSYVTGSVNGVWGVGGLVAGNSGTINRSYSTASVTTLRDSGGLAGANNGTISNSYATGSVTGTAGIYTALGSLVGVIHGNSIITNSYATGRVSSPGGGLIAYKCVGWDCAAYIGSLTNSYWDTAAVGQGDYYGWNLGTGKTTTQMKQQASFSGWDFTNTWQIVEGTSSPTLRVASAQSVTVLTPGAAAAQAAADAAAQAAAVAAAAAAQALLIQQNNPGSDLGSDPNDPQTENADGTVVIKNNHKNIPKGGGSGSTTNSEHINYIDNTLTVLTSDRASVILQDLSLLDLDLNNTRKGFEYAESIDDAYRELDKLKIKLTAANLDTSEIENIKAEIKSESGRIGGLTKGLNGQLAKVNSLLKGVGAAASLFATAVDSADMVNKLYKGELDVSDVEKYSLGLPPAVMAMCKISGAAAVSLVTFTGTLAQWAAGSSMADSLKTIASSAENIAKSEMDNLRLGYDIGKNGNMTRAEYQDRVISLMSNKETNVRFLNNLVLKHTTGLTGKSEALTSVLYGDVFKMREVMTVVTSAAREIAKFGMDDYMLLFDNGRRSFENGQKLQAVVGSVN
jgi:filamentous hemagglutinin family protein